MKKISVFVVLAASLAGSTHALENVQVASKEPLSATRRAAAPGTQAFPGEADMQAVCREVVVATDEGYGITDHVTRFICDEAR